MSASKPRSFRFATAAQWAVCRFVQADAAAARAGLGLRPIAPFARPGTLYAASGAHAPYATRLGEVSWFDDRVNFYCLTKGDDQPEASTAPFTLRGQRVVATPRNLWLASGRSVTAYEAGSLSRRATVGVGAKPQQHRLPRKRAIGGGSILAWGRSNSANVLGLCHNENCSERTGIGRRAAGALSYGSSVSAA